MMAAPRQPAARKVQPRSTCRSEEHAEAGTKAGPDGAPPPFALLSPSFRLPFRLTRARTARVLLCRVMTALMIFRLTRVRAAQA